MNNVGYVTSAEAPDLAHLTPTQRSVLVLMRTYNATVRRLPVHAHSGVCEIVPVYLDRAWRRERGGPVRANTMRALVDARLVTFRTTTDGLFVWSVVQP
jgi:hypothetical protein